MTTTITTHAIETQLTTSAATLVSSSSTESKFIGKMTLTNTSASSVEVTLWLLPTATTETTGSGGNWTWKKTIPAGLPIVVNELIGHVVYNSMKLSGLAGTASVVNVNVSGTTES